MIGGLICKCSWGAVMFTISSIRNRNISSPFWSLSHLLPQVCLDAFCRCPVRHIRSCRSILQLSLFCLPTDELVCLFLKFQDYIKLIGSRLIGCPKSKSMAVNFHGGGKFAVTEYSEMILACTSWLMSSIECAGDHGNEHNTVFVSWWMERGRRT